MGPADRPVIDALRVRVRLQGILVGVLACAALSLGVTATAGAARSGWLVHPVPLPAHSQAVFTGVSCTSKSACTAVGIIGEGTVPGSFGGGRVPLVERWNGSRWSLQPTAPLRPGQTAEFLGVSCSSSTACIAVGDITDFHSAGTTLIERWNGALWSIQQVGTDGSSWLSAVSCSSDVACAAVGYDVPSFSSCGPPEEGWDGTSWSTQPTPDWCSIGIPTLTGVSCISNTGCAAVGNSDTQSCKGGDYLEPIAGF
jgi:hypothetical protein